MSYGRELQYETEIASNPRRRGPLRFEEGVATDTDVPRDFQRGAYGDGGYDGKGGGWAPWVKTPGETMQERAHLGSSTWIEAPSLLSEFVQGAHVGDHEPYYETEVNSGARQYRPNRAVVND
jgi:hypothetical protein